MPTKSVPRENRKRFNRPSLLLAIFLPLLFLAGSVFGFSLKNTTTLATFVLGNDVTLWEELPPREGVWSIWDGTIDKELEGNGDITNPFLIRTAAQLAGWGALVDEGRVESFARLMANVDLNELAWNPISQPPNYSAPRKYDSRCRFFCGYFDGNGYVIKNLRVLDGIDDTDTPDLQRIISGYFNSGLFNRTDATSSIVNCTIQDASIQGYGPSGILVGVGSGNIRNCHVSGTVAGGIGNLGGMIGRFQGSGAVSIKFSQASADVSGVSAIPWLPTDSSILLPYRVGGFVGEAREYFRFDNCRAIGRVVATNGREIGGFIGKQSSLGLTPPPQSRAYYNENLGIWNSLSSVDVIGLENVGGFVGSSNTNTNIVNCSSLGNVSGGLRTGGFAGYNRCYMSGNASSGSVSGGEKTGGFVGVNAGPPQSGFRYSQTGNKEFLRNIGKVVSCGWLQNDTINTHLKGIGMGVTEGRDVDLATVSDPRQIETYNWDQPYAFKPQQYRDAEIVFIKSEESKKFFLDAGGDVPEILSIKPRKIEDVSIAFEENCLTLDAGDLKTPAVHIVSIRYRTADGEKAEKRFRRVLR